MRQSFKKWFQKKYSTKLERWAAAVDRQREGPTPHLPPSARKSTSSLPRPRLSSLLLHDGHFEVPEELRADLLEGFWRQLHPKSRWKPPVRESGGLVAVPGRGLYLFGGLSHYLLSDLNLLHEALDSDGESKWQWSTVEPRKLSDKKLDLKENLIPMAPSSRCGHSLALL